MFVKECKKSTLLPSKWCSLHFNIVIAKLEITRGHEEGRVFESISRFNSLYALYSIIGLFEIDTKRMKMIARRKSKEEDPGANTAMSCW